jgi:hypothetical protein
MNEFKDQLEAAEKEKVTTLIAELRQLAVKGQAGEADITAEAIKAKVDETQQASLGLFQKVPSPYSYLHCCTKYDYRFMRSEQRRTATSPDPLNRSHLLDRLRDHHLQKAKRRTKPSFVQQSTPPLCHNTSLSHIHLIPPYELPAHHFPMHPTLHRITFLHPSSLKT